MYLNSRRAASKDGVFMTFHSYVKQQYGHNKELTRLLGIEGIFRYSSKNRSYRMYTYNWYQWLAFFYIYCFFGWVFESVYVSVRKHRLINRGFLRLPMLPLYGFGAVMMLWVSLPVKENLILVYLSGMVAATILEYVTGSIMEQLFKVRYWDYSNQKIQIHGYICLTSSIAWGFLTILMTHVIHAPIARFVLNLSQNLVLFCTFLISVCFAADTYESTRAALSLGKSLEAMTRLKAEIEEIQARVAALKEEAAMWAAELLKHHPRGELSRLLGQLEDLKAKRRSILHRSGRHHFYRRGLLLGNPGAVSSKFAAALREMREEVERREKQKFKK